jgi:hypothetical protein
MVRSAALLLAVVLGACSAGDRGTGPFATLPLPAPVTTTTAAPATTARPQPPVTSRPPVEEGLRLGEGGLGRARFGEDADGVVAYVGSFLGQDDEDTGWGPAETPYGDCPGNEVRVVRWGWLVLFLTDLSPYGAGRGHFAGWRYGAAVDEFALYPQNLAFATDIAPGDQLLRLWDVYPGAVDVDDTTDPVRFEVGSSFRGTLTGAAGTDEITTVEAGIRCR